MATKTEASYAPILEIASVGTRFVEHGVTTFLMQWKKYICIPIIAGLVGWFTNWLAVKMIFLPIQWRGIPIWKKEDEPLGLIGWQGIIPAK